MNQEFGFHTFLPSRKELKPQNDGLELHWCHKYIDLMVGYAILDGCQ